MLSIEAAEEAFKLEGPEPICSSASTSPAAGGMLLVKTMADSAVSGMERLRTTEAPMLELDQAKIAMVKRIMTGMVTCTQRRANLNSWFGSCFLSRFSIWYDGESRPSGDRSPLAALSMEDEAP